MMNRYYKPKPRAILNVQMILRVTPDGEMSTMTSTYGVGWETGGLTPNMNDWEEISQTEALDLIHNWQLHEWDQLEDIYKSRIPQPQRLTE